MGVSIDDPGLINNEAGPADNPREREFYSHQVAYTEDSLNCSITGWTISGDVPQGISIDGSGVISGTIEGLWEQTSTQSPRKDLKYVEVDCRNYPDYNGRYAAQTYDFTFTTTVSWIEKDGNGACIIPGSTSASHTIKLVKDHDGDAMLLAANYLDGKAGREAYYCVFSGPQTQEQCEAIGGTWNEKNGLCNIFTPQTQAKCEEIGGEWDSDRGMCSLTIIPTRELCENIGGVWSKNTLVVDGITYDNSADYIAAKYPEKSEKLSGILDAL